MGVLEKDDVDPKAKRLRKHTSLEHILRDHEERPMDGADAVLLLAAKRHELEREGGEEEWGNFYRWRLRGGEWAGENKGVAFDCYMAEAIKKTEAENMVAQYKNIKGSGSWTMMYGDGHAQALAKAWCHRHYHFLKLWMDSGGKADHRFSDAEIFLCRASRVGSNVSGGLSCFAGSHRAVAIFGP